MTEITDSSTVDTSNYFAVAASDDRAEISASASGSSTPLVPGTATSTGVASGEDKAAKKARRIVEAVQRSKKEYTADNVYTERGVRTEPIILTGIHENTAD